MSIHIAQTGRHAVLAIEGRFVFEMRSEFLEAMRRVTSLPDCDDISVDLSATEYLDSSAIGMLLILRDRALDAGRQTRITGSAGNVRNVLAMCNIGQLIPLD
ncbi:MAG TPA: STAS domain-containing protein [Azospira sp.]|nr:STAS domain-containing protein [Azospira sp.]HNN45263.1 STAS domain-containing protein [Azospira sp.]